MGIIENERRKHPRRESDQQIDELYQAFSTDHCHHCLQNWDDNVILLNNKKQLVFATSQACEIIQKHSQFFTLNPDFELANKSLNLKLKNYGQGSKEESEPICLIMEDEERHERILLSCYTLPNILSNNDSAARFFIKLHYFCHMQAHKWQGFINQYKLSRAEIRLCRSIFEGQTIKEYSTQWNVTTGTARSQLHDILIKTDTRGQTDLLRLMYLYTRV